MKVLVTGSGGREHTLAWKISQSPQVEKVYCAPGNAGINLVADPVDIKADNFQALLNFASSEQIDLTVVGPEAPLADGIVDLFKQNNLKIFGPTKNAALIEGSKVYSKQFMQKYDIPTADFEIASEYDEARKKVFAHGFPVVIKADGLAAGKGVFVLSEEKECDEALDIIFKQRSFGEAGNLVVIEDKLEGEEASYMVVSDGRNIVPLSSSQDHKAAYDGDKGPNTGGMGAYSPAPIVDSKLEEIIKSTIIETAVNGLAEEGSLFRGLLYAGIMIKDGTPSVLEFNCRFGDPETQPVLMRMKSDLFPLLYEAAGGDISGFDLEWSEGSSVCVVLASNGYPGSYEKGKKILGLEKFDNQEDINIFHAGTAKDSEGNIITNGGRVLGVTATGNDIKSAIDNAYKAVSGIGYENIYFRKDIGYRALK